MRVQLQGSLESTRWMPWRENFASGARHERTPTLAQTCTTPLKEQELQKPGRDDQVLQTDVFVVGAAVTQMERRRDREVKIEMTVPVTCLVKTGCTDFKVSFFVPFKYQDSPPQPTEPGVFIEERKGEAIFVRSFGGFASPEKYAEEAQALARILKKAGQSFHEDFYYTAGYDSPFKLFNRHNEVWYFKK